MQGGADTIRHAIAVPERPAVAPPLDPPQRHPGEPESQPNPCADANAHTHGDARHDTLELA
jgi:hypothetical protein